MNESDLYALAVAFGETRRIKRTETRRGSGVWGESERRQSYLHLLSPTIKLSYCQTIQKMELFRCLGVGKFDSLRVGELESLTVGGLGRQMHPHFSVQLSNCQHVKGMKPLSPISSQTSPRLRVSVLSVSNE